MRHPVDGEAWKEFDDTFKSFADDPCSLRLAIATDGFNTFGQMTNSYSIWPVTVVPYNFPPWMCMDQSNYMLALIIPGKKSPGKDFHVFIQPLIETCYPFGRVSLLMMHMKAKISICVQLFCGESMTTLH
jgi:hypothetical protein